MNLMSVIIHNVGKSVCSLHIILHNFGLQCNKSVQFGLKFNYKSTFKRKTAKIIEFCYKNIGLGWHLFSTKQCHTAFETSSQLRGELGEQLLTPWKTILNVLQGIKFKH